MNQIPDRCPDCGTTPHPEGGCWYCPGCGKSGCSI